jgi:uncharacterized protein YqeY
MTFEEKVRQVLANTPFADKERRNLLKVVIGELQRKPVGSKVSDEAAYNVVKGMIKSNQELMSHLTGDTTKYEGLENECLILRSLLPKYLTEGQIREHLDRIDLKIKSEGQAMGQSMKYFKDQNLPVEGDTVKKVIAAMRS